MPGGTYVAGWPRWARRAAAPCAACQGAGGYWAPRQVGGAIQVWQPCLVCQSTGQQGSA